MVSTPGAAGSYSQGQLTLIPEDVVSQLLLECFDTALKPRPDLVTQSSQIFHLMQSSSSLSSDADVPHPGPREAPGLSTFFGNEAAAVQQSVELMPADPKMGQAAAQQQEEQITQFLKQVFMELQIPKAPTPIMTNWREIRKKALKEKVFHMAGTRNITLSVNYDAQGQNLRWE